MDINMFIGPTLGTSCQDYPYECKEAAQYGKLHLEVIYIK